MEYWLAIEPRLLEEWPSQGEEQLEEDSRRVQVNAFQMQVEGG